MLTFINIWIYSERIVYGPYFDRADIVHLNIKPLSSNNEMAHLYRCYGCLHRLMDYML